MILIYGSRNFIGKRDTRGHHSRDYMWFECKQFGHSVQLQYSSILSSGQTQVMTTGHFAVCQLVLFHWECKAVSEWKTQLLSWLEAPGDETNQPASFAWTLCNEHLVQVHTLSTTSWTKCRPIPTPACCSQVSTVCTILECVLWEFLIICEFGISLWVHPRWAWWACSSTLDTSVHTFLDLHLGAGKRTGPSLNCYC